MPLKITHRKREDVPTPSQKGRINQDLIAIKREMANLASDMVLEVETEGEKAIRGTKVLITKASKELGTRWQHWSVGNKVFARPIEAIKRRGRPKKTD